MPGLLPGWLREKLSQDDANLIKDLYDGLQGGGVGTARAIEYLYTDSESESPLLFSSLHVSGADGRPYSEFYSGLL
jgi:hypothetical protein